MTIRPNLLRDPNIPVDQRSTARWLDLSAFSAPAAGSYGTSSKGVIKGPGSQVVNVGLAKQFSIGERAVIRWEITGTNFFNTPNYTNPGTTITSLAAAGVITGAGGNKILMPPALVHSEPAFAFSGRAGVPPLRTFPFSHFESA